MMAETTNSYGTASGVAAYCPRYVSDAGAFTTQTRPTLNQVNTFVDQVSALLNAMLRAEGFTVPITQSDAVMMLKIFVEQEVADIVEGINGSGRFGPHKPGKGGAGSGKYNLIFEDAKNFIDSNAIGIERLGASRDYPSLGTIGYKSENEAGDEIYPLFQREAFGDDEFQINWDDD